MKFVTYTKGDKEHAAILDGRSLFPLKDIHPWLPGTIEGLLEKWNELLPLLANELMLIRCGKGAADKAIPYLSFPLSAPVPHPPTCRDGYAFRQHVASARKGRGLPMIAEFDRYPVFYFTNPHTIKGPGPIACMPDHLEQLDFELEVAVVISHRGINIRAEEAIDYIAGYMIMNDFSARRLQREEMMLNLGPAKGKDFATATGPWLVTPDELKEYGVLAKANHRGSNFALEMICRVNGKEVSRGNLGDMDWTFAEIIERASYGAELFPGDIIGSGTVGTGCFMELNSTGRLNDPDYQEQWLQPGDIVELEVEGLGILVNTITRAESNRSLLNQKL